MTILALASEGMWTGQEVAMMLLALLTLVFAVGFFFIKRIDSGETNLHKRIEKLSEYIHDADKKLYDRIASVELKLVKLDAFIEGRGTQK